MGLQVDPKELKKRQFFLEGNIPKAVLSVCLPMALFQLINELFRVFDLVITSQINPESVSAVSFFNQLNNSIVSVGTGLSIGAGILIAGLYGAGEYERLKTTVNTTFFMAGAAALVLVAGLILGARPILRLANTPTQLVEIGLNYYRITALNLVFTFFNNVYIAIEKARGNGSKIMRINFAMALTKFSFSAFFVLVLHQGIVMIGVATLLSNLVVTAIGLYNLRNPEDVFGLSFRYVRLKNDIVKNDRCHFPSGYRRKILLQCRQSGRQLGWRELRHPNCGCAGRFKQRQRSVYGSGRKHWRWWGCFDSTEHRPWKSTASPENFSVCLYS